LFAGGHLEYVNGVEVRDRLVTLTTGSGATSDWDSAMGRNPNTPKMLKYLMIDVALSYYDEYSLKVLWQF
jgi:hypothetical protein